MEGTFHYMLMAEQAMVQKHILRTLKDTGLTMGQPKVLEYLMGQSRRKSQWDATWKLRLSRRS